MKHILALAMISLALTASPVKAEEILLGLHYDRARDGHGFELHKLGDTYILYFYTYDRRGDPEWLLGVAEMDNGVLSGDLQRYLYRADANGGNPTATPDPDFDGEFRLDVTRGLGSDACNDGTPRNDAEQVGEFFWRTGNDSGMWCTEFLAVGPEHNETPYYGGVWYAGESDPGYGFTMSHMGDVVSALVYYYDSDGQPRWALGSAPDTSSIIELTNFLGYCRRCVPLPLEGSSAGSIELDWGSGPLATGSDRATIDLSYPLPPRGEFERTFTLNRITDGESRGDFEVDVRLGDLAEYAVVWRENRGNSDANDIWRTQDIGVPFGERTVNTNQNNDQGRPAVAVADDGSYVVVWEDDADGNGAYQILGRGFDALGVEVLPTFTVNTEGAGQQRDPDIAMAPNGHFVVVWEDDQGNDRFGQIAGRGFFADGREKFGQRTINAIGAGNQLQPSVAMADDGSFVVAWSDDQNVNEFYDIAMRGFNANGSERFSQRRVNEAGAGLQEQPDVAMAANGDFVVTWTEDRDLNFYSDIRVRGFRAGGSVRFSERTVNGPAAAGQFRPSVAMNARGDFTIVWNDQGERIAARGYGANGTPSYDEVIVNTDSLPLHAQPTVGIGQDGLAILAWVYLRDDGQFRLSGRTINPAGQPGSGLLITTDTTGSQLLPAIAVR
jgi:hypothetical protein